MTTVDTHPDSSFIKIIKDLRDDATALFRQEVALAKREIAGKAAIYGKNSVFLVLGAVIGIFALFFICLFLNNLLHVGLTAMGISDPVASWLAPLILGMLLGIGGLLLSLKALKTMRREKPVPQKTLDSFREDKDWIRGKMKG
jgi:hypothetical protein